MRIGCCEREQTRNAGVGAAVASLTRHHRPLLHRRRRQSNMEKDACRRSGASQTRSMAWCEVRWSEREAARLDLRAFDDLMERHFGCDRVANSQVVLAVANRRGGLITGGAS
jgi:hypothetical protein